MQRRRRLTLILALSLVPAVASAQLAEDAAPPPADAGADFGVKPLKMFREPADAAALAESSTPRPPPGASVRERNTRRSRGASTASGALFIAVIVFGIGYYVVKRMRR